MEIQRPFYGHCRGACAYNVVMALGPDNEKLIQKQGHLIALNKYEIEGCRQGCTNGTGPLPFDVIN